MEPIRVLVVYDSLTGNVEAMAKAVADGVAESGGIADVQKTVDVKLDSVPMYDAYAFGSPTHCGTMSIKMTEFFNRDLHSQYWGKLRYKVATAFTSSGGLGGGNEMTLWAMLSAILNFGMITFGIPDYVSKNVTLHYGPVAIKKPDKHSLKACRLLGQRLVEHAEIIKRGLVQT